jgi:Dolichyl-phosphate-mannose-protein mannosyltransferase
MKFTGSAGEASTPGSWAARARPWLCRAVPAAAAFAFLAWCCISVRSNFSWDDAEPEILNQGWQLTRGHSIYRDITAPPFAFAAYPPVFYALAALLLKFTGLTYIAAKLISVVSALSIGWAMVRLSREWNRNAAGGLWSTALLLMIPAFLYNSARCHVQMMAVALSIWSFVFFLRNRWTETVVISPLLAVLALYTKQTQVALPIAMAVFLAFRNRRWLLPYAATGTIAALIPLLWLQKATGGLFLYDTVRLAGIAFDVRQIPPVFAHFAGPLLLFLGLALHLLRQRFRKRQLEPIDFYLGCVLVTTVVSLGRLGAHSQYVLELLVVTMLYLMRTEKLPAVRGRDALVAAQVLFLLIYAPLFVFWEEGYRGMACNRAAEKIYPMLESDTGPILSQQGSFALFGRGGIFVQLFHFSALSRAGLWDQGLLLKEIDRRGFSWVITEFPVEDSTGDASDQERFTPEILEALRRNYARHGLFYPYHVYRPRPPGR